MPWDKIENLVGDVLAAPLSDSANEFTPTVAPAAWPDPQYNLIIFPADAVEQTFDNSEYVRVTALNSTTISITRAQEGTSAKSFPAGAKVQLVVTAKTVTDLQAGIDALDVPGATAVTTPDTDSLVGIRDSADGWALKKITLFNLRALFKTAYDLVYLALEPLLIKFGGSTSSFPMLKRNGTTIEAKLADDSAYSQLSASRLVARDGDAERIMLSYTGGLAMQQTIAGGGWVFESNHSAAPPMVFKLGDAIEAPVERLRITQSGLLTFGGITSAFPALKRAGTNLQARLADDSGFANFEAAYFYLANGSFTSAAEGMYVRALSGVTYVQYPSVNSRIAIMDNTPATKVNLNSNGVSYFAGGHVGFGGNTTPSYPVDVTGWVRASSGYIFMGVGSGVNLWVDSTPTKAGRFNNNASGDISIGVYNGTAWTNALHLLNSNGYLGVLNITPADPLDVTGNVRLSGNLKWGGTSSFPMLKRNGTGIDVRCADDSAWGTLQCGTFNANGSIGALAGLVVYGSLTFSGAYLAVPTLSGPQNETGGELWYGSSGGGLWYYESGDGEKQVADRAWVATKKVRGGISFNLKGAITTGVKTRLIVPCDCTITGWEIIADASCSIVLDIWKGTKASQPTSNSSSIAGTEKPTLASETYAEDLTLSSWTTGLSAGDVLVLNVDSVTLGSATEIAVVLRTERTVV